MPVIQPLKDNLSKQIEVYRGLKELADHMQDALVANNLQELEAVTVREEQLMMESSRLEKERLLWSDQMSQMTGKAAEELTLAELAVRYPELQNVKEELEIIIGDLMNVNELNTRLLEQAMSIVNFTVGMLTYQDKNTYRKPGIKNNQGSTGILDQKI